MSKSLRPHGLRNARLPSLPSIVSEFAHTQVHWMDDAPTISFSVIPSSCLQSFPAWGSFLMSQLFESDGHSIGTSATTSVLPMNMQDWFPFRLTGLISLLFKCKIPPWIKLKTHSFSLIPKERNAGGKGEKEERVGVGRKKLKEGKEGKKSLCRPGANFFLLSFFLWPPYVASPGSSNGKEAVIWETWIWSLGWEDPVEAGMSTHSSFLAWRIPWTEETGGLHIVHKGHRESDTTEAT